MNSTKKTFLTSLMALLLCVVMLMGTTFAWFTDVVTSTGNIIQAGNLDAEMYYSESLDEPNWKNADGPAVFNYDKWEPGYTSVRYIKVKNAGKLNFKFQLSLDANGVVSKLGDVIDVYFFNPATEEITTLDGLTKVDNLTNVIKNHNNMPGTLAPGAEVILAIALHMQESAGNEYQKLELCEGGFDLKLIATQVGVESDSFGPDYDDGATWEDNLPEQSTASSKMELNEDGTLPIDLTFANDDGTISITVPAGTKFKQGTKLANLNVNKLATSGANITLEENEETRSFDVHVANLDGSNTEVISIAIKEFLPVGLNMGNYQLYHVEDGQTVEMKLLADGETPVHNSFNYDPATGDVVLHLASFSEVALVADTENAWGGKFDYSWYDAEANELTIANADQLAAFGAIVGGMKKVTDRNDDGTYTYSDDVIQDSFAGKTVKLISDINLGDAEAENNEKIIFYPIGYWNNEGTYERLPAEDRVNAVSSGFYNFCGTFDGNGHTVANFYQNTWEMKGDHNWYDTIKDQYYRDGMGLFGRVYGGTIKNLTVKNFSSDGEIATTGVIAAYADGATFENIAIFNCNPRVYNIGNGGIVGCVGWYAKEADLKTTFKNVTVDNSNKISALWGSYDVACGGIVGQYYPTSGQSSANYPVNAGIHFENCHVAAQMDVYNDVCANYQYYAYRYTGMLIGSIRENETINGHSYPKMDGITADGCTVHFGTWNDYYYCEIIDNTTASYTHDYQMSRLEQVDSVDVENKTYTITVDGKSVTKTIPTSGRYNYVVVNGEHATENATCYHFKDGKIWNHSDAGTEIVDGKEVLVEDKQHIYLEFNNLVTGYGWGVTSKGLKDFEGVTNLDITQGDHEASIEKFEDAGYNPKDYRPGETITIGDLFKVKGNAVINSNSVMVSVSPVTDEDKVIATFVLNTEDWTKSTITFSEDSTGTARVTITDYIFCTPTTIYLNEEEAVEKFTANSLGAQKAYTQITLGTIFGVKNGATIDNVTATFTDPNGNKTTVAGTSADWTTKTIDLVKEGTWTVSIVDDDKYCAATEATFEVVKANKFGEKFTGDFLYRVGNKNSIPANALYDDLSPSITPSNLSVAINNKAGNAEGSWSDGLIKFTGTGVVNVTISADGANSVSINLEVVNAYNVTSYSELKDQSSVFLNDITMTSGGTYRLTGDKVLYGNGFKFDVTKGAYAGVKYDYASYVVYLENSRLDNVEIIGAVYPEVGETKDSNYYRPIVMTSGECSIVNSYISNGASPIRNGGNLELVNTTLKGGAYANLDLRNGHLILDNVTTINQIGANDKYINSDGTEKEVVGMGIVIYQEGGSEELKITIRNGLTQYNYMSKEQANSLFTGTYSKAIKDKVFGSDFENYQNSGWINFGIISMNNYFATEDLVDERVDKTGYFGTSKTVSLMNQSRKCYVYSAKPTNTTAPSYPGYTSLGQGIIKPESSFDYENKNHKPKQEGSNDYCYAEGDTVYISMDEGDTFSWDTSILTATKLGNNLTYTVEHNGVDYTGKSIIFNKSGTYDVVYSYIDVYNYILENGDVTTFEVTYTETVTIEVAVVKATAKHAEFSFGANGTAYSAKTVTIGDKTYVMPDVTATVAGKIGSTTVNGTTVYYPITEMFTSDGTTEHTGSWYACFPIFKNALQIIDYANEGTGNPVTYNQSTVTSVAQIPSTLRATNPTSEFLYQMNATSYPPPTTPSAVSGAVCYTSNKKGLTASNERKEMTITAEYTYTDNAGTVYYFYIGYHCAEQTNGGGCVTPDTLITLADGTQVRVDSLTGNEELLVWNMETGKFDKAPIMFLDSDAEAEYEVIKLYFSDGTEVKVIYEHGFWDYDLNKYVYLDKDAEQYIGHTFAKQNGDKLEKVQLVDVVIEKEMTTAWSPVTEGHLCYFVNGMLSMPGGVGGLFNIFEVDPETMTYDYEQMEKDIETYGLFTYEELNAICPLSEEMFNAAGGAYLKISIGKGNLTMDELVYMINRYSVFFE